MAILPAEVLFTRAVLAFLALLIVYPHHLKLKNPKQEFAFAGVILISLNGQKILNLNSLGDGLAFLAMERAINDKEFWKSLLEEYGIQ